MTDFSGRPDHPDFWTLAAILQDFDNAADDKMGLDRLLGSRIDMDTLMYVVQQRTMRIDHGARPMQAAKLGSMWIDGFAAGLEFQRRSTQGALDDSDTPSETDA